MTVHDVDVPGDEEIEAALEEALNRPLEQLLSIAEFVEKHGAARREEPTDAQTEEVRRAA